MLKILMEFRKGVLFVRLYGKLNDTTINDYKEKVKEVIILSGIKYVVINVENLTEISSDAIKEFKELKKILDKTNGAFFISGGDIKELSSLVKLENELNVFERVVI